MVKFPILAFTVSLLLTPMLIRVGRRFQFLDVPGGLKGHKEPVPFLGGVSIFAALLLNPTLYSSHPLLISIVILFILGFIDDLKHLGPYTKLTVETVLAILMVFSGYRTKLVFLPEWANYVLSILWIVGVTNSFNIIDVMDGIASGVGLISSGTFFLLSIKAGKPELALLSGTLLGGLAGFLPYNLPPAKIFLGDTGSLLIGFTLSIVALETSYSMMNPVAVIVPLFILFFPIFDTFYVFFIRILNRKNPLKGSPDHFVLKLKKQGLDVPVIDAIVFLSGIALCEASYIVTGVGTRGAILVLLVVAAIFTAFGVIIHKR